MKPKETHTHSETDCTVPVAVAEINKATVIAIHAVPISYEIRINNDLICTLNQYENALTVFKTMLCDMKGEIFHG